MKLLGVDTGGTFTDLLLFDGKKFRAHKQLSTPDAPENAIVEGLRALGLAPAQAPDMVHGSTVGTNAVLEGAGVKTAYITNRGFGDVLTLGRQARPEIYQLTPAPVPPPVAPALCLETGGRIGAHGEVIEDLTPEDIATLQQRLATLAPAAVAINLLFSFVDDRFERAIADALEEAGYFVSRSSRVLAEHREYERGIATWLNSYIGPIMQRYLRRLDALLPAANIAVMQSHGSTIAADKAGGYAVNLLLSGPAGGVIAARHLAAATGARKVLGFDMGGTSTDVALIDGDVCLTTAGRIGPYPIATPMVDIHTIGSGGGSIACIDAGGLLRVGPQSAGAAPGPACYGRGGGPTVTDANLLLGRLPEQLGDALTLDREAAVRAFAPLAAALGKSVTDTAQGVVDIVNERMGQALKVMSVQKGYDPAEFMLVGFGAAGGLHICTLAAGLKMRKAMVPAHAGVLSALGMLIAPRGLQKSRTVCAGIGDTDQRDVDAVCERLRAEASDEMRAQGIGDFDFAETAELRYRGQLHCLTLERRRLAELEQAFHAAHENLHGYTLDVPVELVTLRVRVFSASPLADANVTDSGDDAPSSALNRRPDAPALYRRGDLAGSGVAGPAVIVEATSTVYVERGWHASLDGCGNLQLEHR